MEPIKYHGKCPRCRQTYEMTVDVDEEMDTSTLPDTAEERCCICRKTVVMSRQRPAPLIVLAHSLPRNLPLLPRRGLI